MVGPFLLIPPKDSESAILTIAYFEITAVPYRHVSICSQ